MTSDEWKKEMELFGGYRWIEVTAITADLAACERERDALKARLAEARWLLLHLPADQYLGVPKNWDTRRDAWMKEARE